MAHALEVRVPLIDHVLADYVMAVPDPLKAPGATPKPLLVESLGSALPPEIVHRRKKGFTLPFEPWMRNQLRGFCESRLGSGGLAGRGLFDVERLAGMDPQEVSAGAGNPACHRLVGRKAAEL